MDIVKIAIYTIVLVCFYLASTYGKFRSKNASRACLNSNGRERQGAYIIEICPQVIDSHRALVPADRKNSSKKFRRASVKLAESALNEDPFSLNVTRFTMTADGNIKKIKLPEAGQAEGSAEILKCSAFMEEKKAFSDILDFESVFGSFLHERGIDGIRVTNPEIASHFKRCDKRDRRR
ncbi:hypothetical protein NEMIN01_2222 [Nematocida minor]|uniref:uncharacterized protein n=1 Tax=Nematocida minor TaxID=1912983 RepID=UPI00221E9266|nr:uncharacterized protein NEMIN01_2222 [Nematocida minor]KAI5192799.1 hypothetical protein NEMIN01_2222 [Nematocida minor]